MTCRDWIPRSAVEFATSLSLESNVSLFNLKRIPRYGDRDARKITADVHQSDEFRVKIDGLALAVCCIFRERTLVGTVN